MRRERKGRPGSCLGRLRRVRQRKLWRDARRGIAGTPEITGEMRIASLFRLIALVGACSMGSPGAATCSNSGKAGMTMVELSEKDQGGSVDLKIGETLRIRLAETASTGYRWAVDRYDADILSEMPGESSYPVGAAVGSGGAVLFVFEGRKAGSSEVSLKNWRNWEGDSSITARFTLQVKVHTP
jgi:inhibitor of cysteine peptidase